MKALVLAGGNGSRLRPITHTCAKQLVPVANKPVLFYVLEAIREAGIRQVGMIIGDMTRDVEHAVGDGHKFGLEVTFIWQEIPLGLAHAVLIARPYLGDEDFVMYLGDNYISGQLADTIASFEEAHPSAQLMLARVSDPRAFGVAEIGADGQVARLAEKPENPRTDLALMGVYIFSPDIYLAISRIVPSTRGELEITDAIQWLIDNGRRVASAIFCGYWKDTGDAASLLEVNRMVLENIESRADGMVDEASEVTGPVIIEPGAVVSRSRIIGPVIVGRGSRITNSSVGPFSSIEDGCEITNSIIGSSILLRGASIDGVARIQESIIGREARVTGTARVLHVHRLLLGDHSRVDIGG